MLTRSYSASILGVDAQIVTVEAEVGLGLPGLTLVGQVSGALNEARQRVRAALGHSGHELPPRKQLVNLAPAELRKDSPGLDLAIACGLLASHGVIEDEALQKTLFWGELALDGALRPARGTLVVADAARRRGFETLIVAPEAADEAAMVPELKVLPAASLRAVVQHFRRECVIEPHPPVSEPDTGPRAGPDMSELRGLPIARLAVEVMAAGGHNLLLHGPPGVGKTMLARRAAGILPPLDHDAAIEVTKIHGVHGARPLDRGHALLRCPPVRMPHHTVSVAGLLGGGNPPRPGEVSLAHRGILFLDELPEYPRSCLEGLREPLEDGEVSVVRARFSLRFPARFQLMAAMNPCPCGYLGHPERACVDAPGAVQRYQQKISGPLMDRMDLIVPVAPVDPKVLDADRPGESSAEIRARVLRARRRQTRRYQGTPWRTNAELPASAEACEGRLVLTEEARALLRTVARRRQLSPRAQHRLRRVARTLLDLSPDDDAGERPVDARTLGAAAQLRRPPEFVA